MTYFIRSAYFKTALNTDVGPPGDNSKTLEVTEFSYEVLSAAVDFMYGIELPEDFNSKDDLKNLLHLADLYLMDKLKNAVSNRISKDLNTENIFDTSELADTFRSVALTEQCATFIFDNAHAFDEKIMSMKEGAVLASLAKKFVVETKKNPNFKRRQDFGSVADYREYVKANLKPRMFVRCNQSIAWIDRYTVASGHVGFVNGVDVNSSTASVRWLTPKQRDPAHALRDSYYFGPYEHLDLLTSPTDFDL